MPKCSFCGQPTPEGSGKMFVWISGKIDYFCSRKCQKHLIKLKHTPLKTRWTNAYRREHKKAGHQKE